MKIRDIERRLVDLRDEVLADTFEIPDETLAELEFAPPPEPEMGDLGFPCFKLAPILKTQPAAIAEEVAEALGERADELDLVERVEATGPYVNFVLASGRVAEIVVAEALDAERFGAGGAAPDEQWMIEFSAPNTNKPQHLGHVRNNLLGESVASIVEFAGGEIVRTNLINDRGIHICKSMVAYRLDDDAPTPASTGTKGDHFVGEYYVKFAELLAEEYADWQQTDRADEEFERWADKERRAGRLPEDLGEQREQVRASFFETFEDEYFNEYSDLGARAREMLRRWEEGDEQVHKLWETMNGWVLEGFDQTYRRLGIEFDEIDFESETYERGREVVDEGLERGIFERHADGAVYFDLERIGMGGEKILLRADGTTVYMTQDLGTAHRRFEARDPGRMIYVVGDEQEYHFQVLFGILGELDERFEGRLEHLSYGMVDLPEGKMKSREGKVVDADDLMDEMAELAAGAVRERYDDLSDDEIARRAEVIGQAALKYYILDFNPRTNVQFDPEESIKFQGRTGPYCLYSYARVQSIGRRVGGWPELDAAERTEALRALGTDLEMEVVRELESWPETVREAGRELDPSAVTRRLFDLAKAFSSMYNDPDHRIVELEGPRRAGLLLLARAVAETLESGLELLGIETLDEM